MFGRLPQQLLLCIPVSCVVCDVFSPVWVGLFALTKYAGIVKAHITTSPTSTVCFEYPKDASPFCVGMMEKHKPERHSSRHSRSLRKDTEAATGRRSALCFHTGLKIGKNVM